MASNTTREYEAIVFGATGYTGKYTAEHITTHLPTDFKWAVAGRSFDKLQVLVEEIQSLNPDRAQPGIEVAQLEKDELVALAKKTKVLITTVGPYHLYGTAVVEACAETGTHYLDVTGEVPWVYEMVQIYHSTAKKTGAIIIPQNGVESAPADLMMWMLVSHIRKTLNVGTGEVIHAIYDLKAAPSGGTLATILSILDKYSLRDFARSGRPYSMSVVKPPPGVSWKRPLLERITGLRTVSGLGILTDSLSGPTDIPIVGRSWSLYEGGKFYGERFRMSPYMKVRNLLQGLLFHLSLTLGFMALILPPVRWIARRFVYQPGDGATRGQVTNDYVEWRAIANADTHDATDPKKALGRMRWDGSLYHLTGVLLAESALIIAREKTFAHELGGGILTPATLGVKYLERLQRAGLKTDVHTMP